MFRRLIIEDCATLLTVIAFITAASIYGSFAWRALRMKRSQAERLAHLPFESDPAPASHEADTTH